MTLSSPPAIVSHLWQHRYLVGQMVRRDVILKYRGSFMGIGWSFLYPLLLLAVFTLVFDQIIGTRWGHVRGGWDLALFLYCGLLVFTPFAEVASSTPRLLSGYQNLIKKIIFPSEILPLVTVLSATFHGLVNLLLLIAAITLTGHAHMTLLLAPVVLLPAWLFTLGLAWMLAATGVFVRDMAHAMPVLTQLLMFLTPVLYPLEAAPPALRNIHLFNPLAIAMEDLRRVALEGTLPHWGMWFVMLIIGLGVVTLGFAFFMNSREEFADVI
jgi:lipopolysaccharide transport system permease protein